MKNIKKIMYFTQDMVMWHDVAKRMKDAYDGDIHDNNIVRPGYHEYPGGGVGWYEPGTKVIVTDKGSVFAMGTVESIMGVMQRFMTQKEAAALKPGLEYAYRFGEVCI